MGTRHDHVALWKKGQSGNPSGRPKVVHEVQELARQHAPAAIAALAEIVAKGENEQARISAATALLDRGFGKPAQTIHATHQRLASDLNEAELLAIATGRGPAAAYAKEREGETGPVH